MYVRTTARTVYTHADRDSPDPEIRDRSVGRALLDKIDGSRTANLGIG